MRATPYGGGRSIPYTSMPQTWTVRSRLYRGRSFQTNTNISETTFFTIEKSKHLQTFAPLQAQHFMLHLNLQCNFQFWQTIGQF